MDRDRNEPRDSSSARSGQHHPFGVREETAKGPSSVEDQNVPAEGPESLAGNDGGGESASPPVAAPDVASEASAPEHDGATPSGAGSTSPSRDDLILRERVVEAMKTVYDPEIPVNIYDLGMVYEIEVRPGGDVLVTMTLTSPACPVAGTLPGEVEEKVNEVEGVRTGKVDLVWDPPWTPDRMSESAKLELGMF